MKHRYKRFLLIISSLSCVHTGYGINLIGRSFFSPRSQGTDAARYLIGWNPFIDRYHEKSWYGAFAITPQYTNSIKTDKLAATFFGSEKVVVTGSAVSNRYENDFLADYFGLSQDFESVVSLNPSIDNFITSFDFYGGYHDWYFSLHLPAVWTKWELKLCEDISASSRNSSFPELYMGTTEVAPAATSFTEAIAGNRTFGDIQTGIQAGKIDGAQKKGGLAEVTMILGWNFINRENGYCGLNIRAAVPSGTRPSSEYLFEPIIGNGHHAELGLGAQGRVLIWEKDGEQTVHLHATLNGTHLFTSKQKRSFDLCGNGLASRYQLAKEFNSEGVYTRTTIPLINVTTLTCDVSIASQFDFCALFAYKYNQLSFDVGYNAWIRSKEKIKIKECFPEKRYALKGVQNVAGLFDTPSPQTQSAATINGSPLAEQAAVADNPSPQFIRNSDIDTDSAASPRLLTHKIVAHVSFCGDSRTYRSAVPFFGLGSAIEFEGIKPAQTTQPNKNSLSTWHIWLKGGLSF